MMTKNLNQVPRKSGDHQEQDKKDKNKIIMKVKNFKINFDLIFELLKRIFLKISKNKQADWLLLNFCDQ